MQKLMLRGRLESKNGGTGGHARVMALPGRRPVRAIACGLVCFAATAIAGGQPAGQPPAAPAPALSAQGDAGHGEDTSLLTVAERTSFEATARYDDVVELLKRLDELSPLARYTTIGETTEGRAIPMLVIADPPVEIDRVDRGVDADTAPGGPERLTVLAIGNIHGGEVDGKEALPMLAREILTRPDAPENRALLDKLILLVVPIYNCDGNERVAEGSRGPQNGPRVTGARENAQGLDLNRDFIKLAAPETRALVSVINQWDPALFIDCHITNGSFHRYIVTYAGAKLPAGDARVVDYTRQRLFPEISSDFAGRTEFESFWYGNFNGEWSDHSQEHTRWETFPAEGRFGTNYVGLRNRLSVLVETYTYAPFEERVRATQEFVRSTLNVVAARADEVKRLLARVDVDASFEAGPDAIAIKAKESPWPEKVEIAGYVEEVVDGRRRATSQPRDYTVELWDRYEPALKVDRPYAYAIPPQYTRAIDTLKGHGVWASTLDRDVEVEAEVYRVDSATPASREFQGHVLVDLSVTPRREKRTLPAGWVLVRARQTLGNLAVYLLEPHSDDGLARWNFFDAGVKAGEDFPVVRVISPPSE